MAIRYLSGINVDNNVLFVDDANNRVGVGTGNPGAPFEVNSNGGLPIIRARYNATYYTDFDSNGIDFRGASQTFDIKDNGSSAIRIASGGNVGIGTTTPTAPLEITNTGSAGGGYTMFNAFYSAAKQWGMRKYGIDNGTGIAFSSDVQFSSTWYNATRIGHGQNANNPSFQSYYTTYLATTSGNVGIGTTAPGFKLDVVGTTRSSAFLATDSSAASIPFDTGNSKAYFSAVNISGPALTLVADSVGRTIRLSSDGSGTVISAIDSNSTGLYLGTNTNHPISFAPNATERMRITAAGNVGIGTTAPTAKLHAVTTTGAYGSAIAKFEDAWSVASLKFTNPAGASFGLQAYAQDNPSVYTNLILNSSGGNVGIGTTSPAFKLDVSGTFHSGGDATFNGTNTYINSSYIYVGNNTGDLVSISGNTMYFPGNGNVGIGTTAPATLLQVASSQTNSSIRTGGLEMQSYAVNNSWYAENVYFDGSSWRLRSNGYATQMYMQGGTIDFNRVATGAAGDAATLLTTIRLNNTGNVLIGTTTDTGAKLRVYGGFMSVDGSNSSISIESNYGGSGGIEPGTLIAAGGTNANISIIPSGGGVVGTKVVGAAYNGSAWRSMWEFANVSSGEPVLSLVRTAGNVGIGTTSPNVKLRVQSAGSNFITPDNNDVAAVSIYNSNNSSANAHAIISLRTQISGGSPYISFDVENEAGYSVGMDNGSNQFRIAYGWNSLTTYPAISITPATSPNVLIGTTTDSGYKLAVNGTITTANYSYLSTYGYGATQLRTYEISTGTSVSDNQVFNLYLGRFGNGYHRITLWGTGYGTDSGNYFDITRTWNGTPSIITNGGLIMGGAQYTIHWAAVSSGQYDLFIKWYAGMPTGYSNIINYAIQSNTGYQYVQFDYPGGVTVPTLDSSNLVAARMTIQYTSGNVGIGTTAPFHNLSVAGKIGGATFSDSYVEFPSSGHTILKANNDVIVGYSQSFYVKQGGNVGIGTTAPTQKLEVVGSAAGDFPGIALTNTNTGGSSDAVTAIFRLTRSDGTTYSAPAIRFVKEQAWTTTASTIDAALTFSTTLNEGTTERMRITSDGNVGIGTAAPTARLTIGANTSVQSTNGIALGVGETSLEFVHATFQNGFGSKLYSVDSGNGITSLRIATRPNSTSWSDAVTIIAGTSGNGNVGIGTTAPTEKLHVDGNAVLTYNNSYQGINSVGNKAILARVSPTTGIVNYAEYATAANLNGFVMGSDDARVKGNIATDSLEFITNGSTRMTVLSSGYVGVNTTTPGTNFHVVGDVLIQTGALGVGVNPNATDGRIDASNDIVAYSSSDRRLKENITPIANALDKVKSLTGVEFDWKPEHKKAHGYEGHDTGVIAQEVQEVMPTAVRTNDTGYLAVRYEKMIGLLIEAMKEQQTQIDELKTKLDGLTK